MADSELTIGVIGGMGPEATLDYFAKVIAHTPARVDQDHLHLIIDDDPKVPNRHEAIAGRAPSVGPRLAATARRLETAGADFLVMTCNTAHAYAAEIRAATGVPFVSIIDETCDEVMRRCPGIREVGLLAASGCLQAQLFQEGLRERGAEALVLSEPDQARFMELVFAIKSGDRGDTVRQGMASLARDLVGRGAAMVIAGCTEVPLVLAEQDLPVPLIDSTDVLARRSVAYARRLEDLPVASS